MPCKPGVAGSIPDFSIKPLLVEPSGVTGTGTSTGFYPLKSHKFFFFFFWYYIRPPRPVEKLYASETVEYAFKKVEQLRLFKGANLRVGVAPPQILWSSRQGFRG